jgi:hypothetical protein
MSEVVVLDLAADLAIVPIARDSPATFRFDTSIPSLCCKAVCVVWSCYLIDDE